MTRELTIAGRRIADDTPPYLIAEIGSNHGGDLDTARRLVSVAVACRWDAIKLQKRDVDTLYTRALLDAPYTHAHSYGPTYGAHRWALELNREQVAACFVLARDEGIAGFATPFDEASADLLASLDVPAFKLHSGALTDHALIRHVAAFGKPTILSTGGGTMDDIAAAVRAVGDQAPFALLHCTASYPLAPSETNLNCIEALRSAYPDVVVGWSSHAPGLVASIVAVVAGARIIEHHVTLNRGGRGTDHGFSLEPKGMATLAEDLASLPSLCGDGVKQYYDSERGPIAKMRRRMTPEGLKITGEMDKVA